jgi:hypothetical protein
VLSAPLFYFLAYFALTKRTWIEGSQPEHVINLYHVFNVSGTRKPSSIPISAPKHIQAHELLAYIYIYQSKARSLCPSFCQSAAAAAAEALLA